MNQTYTKRERIHVEQIKRLPCSVCDAPGPSSAHHIRQNNPWLCVALCQDCHTSNHNGIHGRMAMWKIHKLDELGALAITIRRLLDGN